MSRYISLLLFIGLAWGQDCTADDGTEGVELWGECYSIENTDSLDLSGSWDNPGELTGSIPPEIGNLTNLTYLSLRSNQLTGTIPPEIGNLTNLINLDLGNNSLEALRPQITRLTTLTSLNLSSNNFEGLRPLIGKLRKLPNLTELDLSKNRLTEFPVPRESRQN